MTDCNMEIREAIRRSRIKQYEIANKIGVNKSTLNVWLHVKELPPERKEQILRAIDEIKAELEEE